MVEAALSPVPRRVGLAAVWVLLGVLAVGIAALEWTEAVTRIADTHVSDEVYERVRPFFEEPELVALTMALVAVNGWNRLAVSLRAPAGTYQPHAAVV